MYIKFRYTNLGGKEGEDDELDPDAPDPERSLFFMFSNCDAKLSSLLLILLVSSSLPPRVLESLDVTTGGGGGGRGSPSC